VDDAVFRKERGEVSYLTIIMFSFIIIRLVLITNTVVILFIGKGFRLDLFVLNKLVRLEDKENFREVNIQS